MSRSNSFQKSSVFLLPLVAALWCFMAFRVSADPAKAPLHPVLTADQAVKIASSFCSSVGAPVTARGEAIFPAPLLRGEDPYYSNKRWQVRFPGQATVEVEDKSGIIARYENEAYFAPPRNQHDAHAGKGIIQGHARTRANSYLAATHFVSNNLEGLKFAHADEEQTASPPTVSSHTWMMTWQRIAYGIPFEYQHLSIMMNAETGELIGLGFYYPSPTSTLDRHDERRLSVNATTAAKIANHLLTRKGHLAGSVTNVELRWIRPDSYWTNKKSQPISQVPVKAWIVTIKDKDTRYLVKVNAETGTIAGGETQGTLAAE